jgi:hypothetical protein
MRRAAAVLCGFILALLLFVAAAEAATPTLSTVTKQAGADVAPSSDANADGSSTPTETGTAGAAATPSAASPKKKKAKKAPKKKPVEVVDLMLDIGGSMCASLGSLVKRKRFNVASRCDLLKFCIEDLAGMFDAMAGELELTQLDMVDSALRPHHFMTLQMNMKNIVKAVLAEKKPTEEWVSGELNRLMSQWVLNVATQQGADKNGMNKLTREAHKNIRHMGIKLPNYGVDDDDTDEEDLLLGDDYEWARESNSRAAAKAAADDDDDEDDDEL